MNDEAEASKERSRRPHEEGPVTYTGDAALPAVTGEMLRDALQLTRPYTVCILKATPAYQPPGPARESWVADLIWEHGKRNYALYLAGLLRIVCPIGDGSGTTGVSIFDADPDEVDQLMRQDPGVKAGLFSYEIHATQTFQKASSRDAWGRAVCRSLWGSSRRGGFWVCPGHGAEST